MHEGLQSGRREATTIVEPVTDVDERRLLARVAAHDRRAMQEFYLLYHRRLVRFLARVTRRRELVDEIINDTLLIVWQRAALFRGESRISTWVMGIAWRHGLRSFKREQRAGAYPALPEVPPVAETELLESRDTLDRAMRALSAEQRAVIELAYVGGYSCDEIGTIMGCPVNTVKTRLFYARRKVRRILAVDGVTGSGDLVGSGDVDARNDRELLAAQS